MALYLLEAVGYGTVKIGRSRDLRARLRSISTNHFAELRVLGICRGGSKERKLHRLMREFHIRGEWFAWNDESRLHLDECCKRLHIEFRDVNFKMNRSRVPRPLAPGLCSCRFRKAVSRGKCARCLRELLSRIDAGELTDREAVDQGLIEAARKPGRKTLIEKRQAAEAAKSDDLISLQQFIHGEPKCS
jgi:hypothetical protein